MTVTDGRRQQLNGGPVHHGLATLEAEARRMTPLRSRVHGQPRASWFGERRISGRRRIRRKALAGRRRRRELLRIVRGRRLLGPFWSGETSTVIERRGALGRIG